MDRWPPYGGGREGRFDCIYIYIYIYIIYIYTHIYVLRTGNLLPSSILIYITGISLR